MEQPNKKPRKVCFKTYLPVFLTIKVFFISAKTKKSKAEKQALSTFYYLRKMKHIILITGGQRSGKSAYAEQLALRLSPRPVYLTTAHIGDDEFRERVRCHRERRGDCWTNLEEEKYLSQYDLYNKVVVVDCITLWCTNFFYDRLETDRELPDINAALREIKAEFDQLTAQEATFIFVTNEIGSGGVSTNAVQRRFTDMEGWMNQYVAQRADKVIQMVSGIPVTIKDSDRKDEKI